MIGLFSELAFRAGQIILDARKSGFEVMEKSDLSPVTEADRKAEALILDGLNEAAINLPVVAEEACSAGHCPTELTDRFLLIDPLDGTKEFVKGLPDFTVNIALIEYGVPIMGVVYAPITGHLYSGFEGKAYKTILTKDGRPGKATQIRCRPCETPPCIVASKSHCTAETTSFISCFEGASTASIGSSLKFCLVAEGQADVYPRFSRTMEWDTAAGDAVLRAAGGNTITTNGASLVYGKRNQSDDVDYANPHFLTASNSAFETIAFEKYGFR